MRSSRGDEELQGDRQDDARKIDDALLRAFCAVQALCATSPRVSMTKKSAIERPPELPEGLCFVVADDDKIARLLVQKQIAKLRPHVRSVVLGASREETERGLRVLAKNAEEWCVLWVSEFTGEELWRVKKVDTTKVRFVREKLVALKEDRL